MVKILALTHTLISQRRIFTPSTFFNVFPQTGHFPKNFCLAK